MCSWLLAVQAEPYWNLTGVGWVAGNLEIGQHRNVAWVAEQYFKLAQFYQWKHM